MVYINGEPRGGDPYSYGYLKIPFLMKRGHNEFLFPCGRGRLQAKVIAPKAALGLNADDATLPDIVAGETGNLLGAIPIVNCSSERCIAEVRVDGRQTNS